MTLWVIIGLIALILTFIVIIPLFREGSKKLSQRDNFSRQIYIDQLDQLEIEVEQGQLQVEAAESARAEIARRLLATTNVKSRQEGAEKSGKFTAFYLATAIPTAALGLYLTLGAPHIISKNQGHYKNIAKQSIEIEQLVNKLAEKLEKQPDDPLAWGTYAQALFLRKDYANSAKAWEKTLSLDPDNPESYAKYAEALILHDKGSVKQAARQALGKALALDSGQPLARYYAGLAASQAGDLDVALRVWISLLAETKPNVPWRQTLETQIKQVANRAGIPQESLREMLSRSREAIKKE